MNAGRFERVRELFDRACDLAPVEREALLNHACAGDAELRQRVDRLLRQTERASSPIDVSPVGDQIRSALTSIEARPLPERVGRFRVLRLIGRGGMGAVYEAEQDNPRRSVALKVVRSDTASPDVLRRFEHEAQILGRLQHPGIACIHEAGIADLGSGPQPYLAMELIRGSGLRAYLAAQNLDQRSNLDLFVRICEAVDHAHRSGVVHRDLKPSNILIDESGQPKVVDFGVARVTTPGTAGVTMHTRTGQIMGTLTYMSPEQIVGDGASVDGRSDVYALGVILFELLTARLPHDFESRSLAEAARMIREEEPSRLSSINSSLRGDLETIVAKALEKDASRRYASAGDLASDVRRYLRDEPIRARPASTVYQLRKFARRHREVVAGIGAVIVVLAIGLVAASWFAVRESRQRRIAESNEAKAEWSSYRNCIAAADRSLQLNDSARAIALLETAPAALRGWEWRYLRHSADQSRLTIMCPDGPATSLAMSDKGDFVVGAGADGNIRGWSTIDGALVNSFLAHAGGVKSIALSPDGMWLVSSGNDARVRGWKRGVPEPLWTIEQCPPVHPQAFSADSRTFTLARSGEIALIDIETGRAIRSLASCPSVASMAAQSADGQLLVYQLVDTVVCIDRATRADLWRRLSSSFKVGAESTSVWVYSDLGFFASRLDARTGEQLHRFDEVLGIYESADGRRLAMPERSGAIVVRDARSFNVVTTLRGHGLAVTAAVFRADGSLLASAAAGWGSGAVQTGAGPAGVGGEIKLWTPSETGASFVILGSNDAVVSGAILPTGTRAVTGGWSGVKMWDLSSGQELWTAFPALREYHTIAFSPDGKRIAAGGYDGALLVLSAEDGSLIAKSKATGAAIAGCAWTPDGTSVATACSDSILRVFDAASGESVDEHKLGSGSLGAVAATNGEVAASSADQVWSIPTAPRGSSLLIGASGAAIKVDSALTNRTPRLAWDRSGSRLAIGTDGGALSLWDRATRSFLWSNPNIKADIRSIAFSAAGDRIVAGCADASLHIIDTKNGDELLTLRAPRSDVFAVTFYGNDSSIGAVFGAEPGGIVLFETADSTPVSAARRDTHATRALVDERFAKQVFASDVVAGIRADRSLAPSLRDSAIRLAEARGDHPNYLNSQAWAVVRYAGAPKDELALAIRKSRRACQIRPEHASFLNTLGVGLIRAGELEEARQVLEKSIEIRRGTDAPLHPLDLLSLAIVEAKLGEKDKARASLAAGETLIAGTAFASDPECVSFLSEASEAIGK